MTRFSKTLAKVVLFILTSYPWKFWIWLAVYPPILFKQLKDFWARLWESYIHPDKYQVFFQNVSGWWWFCKQVLYTVTGHISWHVPVLYKRLTKRTELFDVLSGVKIIFFFFFSSDFPTYIIFRQNYTSANILSVGEKYPLLSIIPDKSSSSSGRFVRLMMPVNSHGLGESNPKRRLTVGYVWLH